MKINDTYYTIDEIYKDKDGVVTMRNVFGDEVKASGKETWINFQELVVDPNERLKTAALNKNMLTPEELVFSGTKFTDFQTLLDELIHFRFFEKNGTNLPKEEDGEWICIEALDYDKNGVIWFCERGQYMPVYYTNREWNSITHFNKDGEIIQEKCVVPFMDLGGVKTLKNGQFGVEPGTRVVRLEITIYPDHKELRIVSPDGKLLNPALNQIWTHCLDGPEGEFSSIKKLMQIVKEEEPDSPIKTTGVSTQRPVYDTVLELARKPKIEKEFSLDYDMWFSVKNFFFNGEGNAYLWNKRSTIYVEGVIKDTKTGIITAYDNEGNEVAKTGKNEFIRMTDFSFDFTKDVAYFNSQKSVRGMDYKVEMDIWNDFGIAMPKRFRSKFEKKNTRVDQRNEFLSPGNLEAILIDWANLTIDKKGKGVILLGAVSVGLNGIVLEGDKLTLYDEKGRSVTGSDDGGLVGLHDLVIKGQECYVKAGGGCYKLDLAKEKSKKIDFLDVEKKALRMQDNIILDDDISDLKTDYWVNVQSIRVKKEKTKFYLGEFLLKGVAIDNSGILIVKDESGKVIAEENKNEWLNTQEMLFDKKGVGYWGSTSVGRRATSEAKLVFVTNCSDMTGKRIEARNYWIDMKDSTVVWSTDENSSFWELPEYQKFKSTARAGELILTLGKHMFILKNIRQREDCFTILDGNVERELAGTFIRLRDVIVEKHKIGDGEVELCTIKRNASIARIGSLKKRFQLLLFGEKASLTNENQMVHLKNIQYERKRGVINVPGHGLFTIQNVHRVVSEAKKTKADTFQIPDKTMIIDGNGKDISSNGEYSWVQ